MGWGGEGAVLPGLAPATTLTSDCRPLAAMKRLFKKKAKADISSVDTFSEQPVAAAPAVVADAAANEGTGSTLRARAIADYTSEDPDDLTFRAGQVIEVTDRGDGPESWWEGTLDGREGCFPGTFVMLMGQARPKTFTAPEDQDPNEVVRDVLAEPSRPPAEEAAFADRLGPRAGGDSGASTQAAAASAAAAEAAAVALAASKAQQAKMPRSAMKGRGGVAPKKNKIHLNMKVGVLGDFLPLPPLPPLPTPVPPFSDASHLSPVQSIAS